MAMDTVTDYMDIIKQQNPDLVDNHWGRIKAGYILSKNVGADKPLSTNEQRVADIFTRKADVSHQIHCSSRVRIGNRTLQEWLSPDSWRGSLTSQRQLLYFVSLAKPWVIPGNSAKSLLMRELSWSGRMFGAFTDQEIEHLQTWIDQLGDGDDYGPARNIYPIEGIQLYSDFNKKALPGSSIGLSQPMFEVPLFVTDEALRDFESQKHSLRHVRLTERLGKRPFNLQTCLPSSIIALWFSHIALLENLVASPYRASQPIASHIIRVLRADNGFLNRIRGVTGTNYQTRPFSDQSLVSMGLQISKNLGEPQPTCLGDVLAATEPGIPAAIVAKGLLEATKLRIENELLLIGLAMAFLDLEVAVANNQTLLGSHARQTLHQIITIKTAGFADCLRTLESTPIRYEECVKQYFMGRGYVNFALQKALV